MYYFIGPVTTLIGQDESPDKSPSWLRIPTNLLVKSERLVVVVVSAAGTIAVETVHVAQADRTACAAGGGSAMPDSQLSAAARTGRRMNDDDEDDSATKKMTISTQAFLVFVLSGLAVSLLCVLIVCAYKLRVRSRRNRKQVEVCGNQVTASECDNSKSNTTKANRSVFCRAEKGIAHSVFEDDAGENHSKVGDILSDDVGAADETASNPSRVYDSSKMSSSGQPTDKTRTDSEDIDWGHYEDIYISRSVYV
jgi:hypothetical protein